MKKHFLLNWKNQFSRLIRLISMNVKYSYRKHVKNEDFIPFQCNICGNNATAPIIDISGRETPSCNKCGSTLRFRSLMFALSNGLFSENIVLPLFPFKKRFKWNRIK